VTKKFLCFALRVNEGWGARKIMSEFPGRNWKPSSLNKLFLNRWKWQSSEKTGSGRPRTVRIRTPENIVHVSEMICSQRRTFWTFLT